MALPSSGPISLKQVRDELKLSGSINLGQQEVRNLANISNGRISMSDLRGKSAREWDQDFKDKYGNQYKGEYKENNSYNIGDIVGMKDLEEALVFEVTVPYNRENPDLSSFRKFYKIKEKMAFRKIRDNYWDIIFEEEEQLNFSTTTFIEGQRAYSSTVDNYYPYSHIKRVLLKNGVEQYELNDTDSTKKKDGSPAKLDGTDGDVMVRIPKFYGEVFAQDNNDRRYRIYNYHNPIKKIALGVKVHPYFINPLGGYYDNRYNAAYFGSLNKSNQFVSINNVTPLSKMTIDEFLDYAHQERNNNYHITSMLEWSTTHFLYTIEFANLDSQKIIGKGYKYLNITGASNIIGNGTGKLSNERNSYRGMEDLIGSGYYCLSGFLSQNDKYYYTTNLNNLLNKDNMTIIKSGYAGNYIECDFNYAENIKGYEELLIPKENYDYSKNYYCDYVELSFTSLPMFVYAGCVNGNDFGGLSYFSCANNRTSYGGAIGSRLSYANMI